MKRSGQGSKCHGEGSNPAALKEVYKSRALHPPAEYSNDDFNKHVTVQ